MKKNVVTRALMSLSAAGLLTASLACSSAPDDEPVVKSANQELLFLECTEQAATCIESAQSIADLTACNEDFASCLEGSARDAVGDLPATVTDAVAGIADCGDALRQCVQSASSPSDLVACEQDQISCVGDVLEVPLAAVGGSELTSCVEDASQCVQSATTVSEVTACGDALAACAGDAAGAAVDALPLPSGVSDTVGEVEACLDDLRVCIGAAQSPSDLVACEEAQATCLGDALGVGALDPTAAADCADDAVSCIGSASSAGDLAGCADAFASCAGSAAGDAVDALPLPDDVGTAIDTVLVCSDELRSCVAAAQTASDLVACQEAQAQCVAGALAVDLPTGGDLASCADAATECALNATSASELVACGEELLSCASAPLSATGVPLIDCSAEFTECLALNPFDTFGCAEQARQCQLTNP